MKPLDEKMCRALINRYPNDIDLWDRFWDYVGEMVEQGASYEAIKESADLLEKIWLGTR
jgi:hypothetical protein